MRNARLNPAYGEPVGALKYDSEQSHGPSVVITCTKPPHLSSSSRWIVKLMSNRNVIRLLVSASEVDAGATPWTTKSSKALGIT